MHPPRGVAALTLALTLAFAIAVPVAAAEPATLPTEPMSAADAAAIDDLANAILAANTELPALYVSVWDPARGAHVAAYGVADRATGRAASVDDHFRIGSISKTFTAAVVLQLIDEGKLRLDDTVATADPDLASRFPALADITIEQLLGMRSGIPDYMNVKDAAVAAIAQDPSRVWTADELIAFGVGGEVAAPGTGGYSTTNYLALQEIAETITGQPLAQLINDRLADPLGMTQTSLPPNDDTALPAPVARGYLSTPCVEEITGDGGTAEVGTDTTDWNASYGQGGGGMTSTIADLGTWASSLSGSSLLSPELAAQRLDAGDVGLGDLRYGLGIIDYQGRIGHEGEALGWEGWASHDPATGVTVVVFTNTCSVIDKVLSLADAFDPAPPAQ